MPEVDSDLSRRGPRTDMDARDDGHGGVDICGPCIACPHCGADDEQAFLRLWGEGVDADFHCNHCGASGGVR